MRHGVAPLSHPAHMAGALDRSPAEAWSASSAPAASFEVGLEVLADGLLDVPSEVVA